MKTIGLTLFLLFAGVVSFLFYRSHTIREKNFTEGYSGIVKEIKVSVQGYHTAVLNNEKKINLSAYRSCLSGKIMEGDSVFKKPESWKLFVYRQKREGFEIIKICDH